MNFKIFDKIFEPFLSRDRITEHMKQHVKSKRPRTDPDINAYFPVTDRRFELKNEDIELYRSEVTRCWARMDLPIRFFDRPEHKRMVMAVLKLTRCQSNGDKINMTAYHLKLQLDKHAGLVKQIIKSRGSEWAMANRLEVMVDHYSPKCQKFSMDFYGILLNIKTENHTCGIFLKTERVGSKINAISKEILLETLKVKPYGP